MAEARWREGWDHTAALLAQTYNIWRPKGHAEHVERDHHPYYQQRANQVRHPRTKEENKRAFAEMRELLFGPKSAVNIQRKRKAKPGK